MKKPAARISAKRIGLVCVALLGAAGFALFAGRPSRSPSLAQSCEPLPSNVATLGGELSPAQVEALLGSKGTYSAQLRALHRPGVSVHEFRTGVTGGHLVLRRGCYIGHVVAWIR